MIIGKLQYLILAAIITTAVINIYINNIVNKGTLFMKWQNVYLPFVIFHSAYVFVIRLLLEESYYLDIAAPFALFYPPFYYTGIFILNSIENITFKKILIHFYPALFSVFSFIVIGVFFDQNLSVQMWFGRVMFTVSCILFIGYAVFSYIKVYKNIISFKIISVIRQSLILVLTVALLFSALIIANNKDACNQFNSIAVYMVIFLTVMIIFRYNFIVLNNRLNELNNDFSKEELYISHKSPEQITNRNHNTGSPEIFDSKYKRSRIGEKELQNYLKKVQDSLDEKIYLEPELTLEKLSKQLHIPKYYLTQVFTLGFKTNFNKLINRYRIAYAEKLLQDHKSKLTIEEIGMESGFNSRSSFYRAFNLYYEVSPVDFRKKILEDIEKKQEM